MLEDAVGGALAFAEQQQEDLEGLIKILKTAQVKPCPIQISKKKLLIQYIEISNV